ncbi:uncharacterized protein LOC123322114 [Coccinella septempunctata]|uniref:uncharacterized protein LOC123322114 n=1 Tax=Coccinella septempunctata TaxID=41139 RepID=UPI001D0698F5|nr:uncharacterized protein LOC123322114 [Coccinella septempunctata]
MERLIESVRENPCLWKVDEEYYKNSEMKEAAWRKVIVECEISDVKEAKSMWKKLRDGHRQALNKKKTTTGQAAGSDKLWKYEKQMSFLVPHSANRQRSTNATSIQASQLAETDESLENTRDAEDDSQSTITNKEIEQTNYNYNSPRNKRKNDKLIEYLEHEQKRRDQKSIARDQLRQELLSMKRKEDTALHQIL